MKVKVAKWGNSLGVRLPKAAVESAGVTVGSEFDLAVENGELRLKPSRKTSAQWLEEMLAEIDRRAPRARKRLIGALIEAPRSSTTTIRVGLIVPGPDGAPVGIDQSSEHPAGNAMPAHDVGDIAWVESRPGARYGAGEASAGACPDLAGYLNETLRRAVICPISTKLGDWPFNVPLPPGLKTKGWCMVDQVRSIDRAERMFRHD